MANSAQIIAAVGRGAAWLDRTQPGWFHKIPMDHLNLSEVKMAPLRWVYGDEEWDLRVTAQEAFRKGLLYAFPPSADAATATLAWREEIARRKN